MTNPYQSPSEANERSDRRCRSLAPTWLMWVAVSSWMLPVAGLLLGIVLFVVAALNTDPMSSPMGLEFAALCSQVGIVAIIAGLLLGPLCTAVAMVSTIWTRGVLLHGCVGVVVNGLFWALLMVMLFSVRAKADRRRERQLEMQREPVSWQHPSQGRGFPQSAIAHA